MSTICPVCNGLMMIQPVCSRCQRSADDLGRYTDSFGPYEPYRDIDDLKLTDGYTSYASHHCLHLCQCSECGYPFILPVEEW